MSGTIKYRYMRDGVPVTDWYFLVDLDQNPRGMRDAGGRSIEGEMVQAAFLAFTEDSGRDLLTMQARGGWITEFRRFRDTG